MAGLSTWLSAGQTVSSSVLDHQPGRASAGRQVEAPVLREIERAPVAGSYTGACRRGAGSQAGGSVAGVTVAAVLTVTDQVTTSTSAPGMTTP